VQEGAKSQAPALEILVEEAKMKVAPYILKDGKQEPLRVGVQMVDMEWSRTARLVVEVPLPSGVHVLIPFLDVYDVKDLTSWLAEMAPLDWVKQHNFTCILSRECDFPQSVVEALMTHDVSYRFNELAERFGIQIGIALEK